MADGPNIAHVLYREAERSEGLSTHADSFLAGKPEDEQRLGYDLWVHGQPDVATMRRQDDGSWRLVLEHDFLKVSGVFIAGVRVKEEDEGDE